MTLPRLIRVRSGGNSQIMKLIKLASFLILFLAIDGISEGQGTFPAGQIAFYPLSGDINDYSGNGNNGQIYGNYGPGNNGIYVTNELGISNGAYLFDGTVNSAIIVPFTLVNNLNVGTISTWLYLNRNTEEVIFSKQRDGGNSLSIFSVGSYSGYGGPPLPGSAGQIYFHSQNGTTVASSSTNLATGSWYHVVVTFSSSECDFYVNGIPAGTAYGNFSIPGSLDYDDSAIGSWQSYNGSQYLGCEGEMNDFRIFDQALSPYQVQQLYFQESCAPTVQINVQPTNIVVSSFTPVTLSVGVLGLQSLFAYQWTLNGTNLPGATSN